MRFLFRIDNSKENDEFMKLRRTCVDQVYAGIAMKIGSGWIPDFIEVSVDMSKGNCSLTLIELEATETVARASSRKYLAESSSSIIHVFIEYLDSVLSQCRNTADPRIDAFQELRDRITSSGPISVRTAAALRTSSEFLEELPLIDQPDRAIVPVQSPHKSPNSFIFQGERVLSREENNGLRRTMRILDAVIMGRDHSGGTLHSWRNIRTKPLEQAISAQPGRYPALKKLMFSDKDTGIRVNCDQIAKEITDLWSRSEHMRLNNDQIVDSIRSFYNIAVSFGESDRMQRVFEQARSVIERKTV
jgi:hypothetical protein